MPVDSYNGVTFYIFSKILSTCNLPRFYTDIIAELSDENDLLDNLDDFILKLLNRSSGLNSLDTESFGKKYFNYMINLTDPIDLIEVLKE